ncbi:MAG TPA: CocE/NonD family hydrolase, partial [Candidatus Binatia bacterium]|nr:CocE/NonD family hydrolase [Candidatus Binatia bacterium]
VSGQTLQFEKVSPKKGTFRFEFLKDGQDRHTRFRIVNDTVKMEITGIKKSDLDDGNADPASPSDRQGYFERHYRKTEQLIPMRDGVKLFTQIYSPIDQSESHPFILFRTPYGSHPYGKAFQNKTIPSLFFCRENYILVYQDIRGMAMSEGTFEFIRPYKTGKRTSADIDESSDAYDTVEWLLKNIPGHNGKVGVVGCSYPGFLAAMAAIDAHPAVLAVSPQAPMADLFVGDDGHHNGALYLAHYLNYLYSMGQVRKGPSMDGMTRLEYPTPDGYEYFLRLGPLKNISARIFAGGNALWNEALAHESYDQYWKTRSLYPHLNDINPAVLTVGGWYDAEDLMGTLLTYKTIEKKNPGLRNTIVMGPWRHSGWSFFTGGMSEDRGVFSFSGTRAFFQEKIELHFFNYYLKGKGPLDIAEAVVFETGSDQWRSFDSWPPAGAKEKRLLFGSGGRVSFDPELQTEGPGFDEYVSDPAKPVPYTTLTTAQYNREYLVEDQRFAASRPDVLVYSGETLTEDMTISGPIQAGLFVSTTGTDADWVVKVIDVYPDDAPDPKNNPQGIRMGGYQRLVRGEILRGKFRNGLEKPEPFVPGRVTRVRFELPDVQHVFRKGHRIMVQVQSSWFPLFDRNPQTFCNIRTAAEKDFRRATQRLYHSRRYPSALSFRVLEKN